MSSNPLEQIVTFTLYKDRQKDFCNIYAGPSKIQTNTLPTQTYSVKQERALSFSETLSIGVIFHASDHCCQVVGVNYDSIMDVHIFIIRCIGITVQ